MRRRILIAVALAGAIALVGCTPEPRELGDITSAEFEQNQAIPNYDATQYTVTDAARLDELQAVLASAGWTPGWTAPAEPAGCTGGVSSDLTITFADETTEHLSLYDCQTDDKVTIEVTALLSSWHPKTK